MNSEYYPVEYCEVVIKLKQVTIMPMCDPIRVYAAKNKKCKNDKILLMLGWGKK